MENHNGVVKTKQQMADEYGVCRKTFAKLLIRKHIKIGRGLIYPKDQLNIYAKLGNPGLICTHTHTEAKTAGSTSSTKAVTGS